MIVAGALCEMKMTELALDGQKDGLGTVEGFLVEEMALRYLEAYSRGLGRPFAFCRDSHLRLERPSLASIRHKS